MNLDEKKKVTSTTSIVALGITILGLIISSWKLSILSLLVFSISSNVYTILMFIEKISAFERINNLLKRGVFDDVIKLPDDDGEVYV